MATTLDELTVPRIDDEAPLSSSSSSSDLDYDSDSDEYSDTRVEDEDWERAEGAPPDFTKQFNRLRQHVAIRTGNAQGISSAAANHTAVVPVPAVNHPVKSTAQPRDRTTDQLAALAKFSSRIAKIDVPYTMGVGVNRKGPSAHANMKDRADRATTEQVLDPRTRTILLKMVGRGVIDEVNGCISTGKEANVYHALSPDKAHLALKIYKTSILVFKDRDKYVAGEHRFRRGYARHNPRKMVRLWAEKEMRNLKRLRAAGILAPEPLEVRENVLVMSFLGDPDGWAAPRLKDAVLPAAACAPLYRELLRAVRTLFHTCHLVHADLSEYNILYHEEHLYIIDVSQSVEHDHPAAFDFLRNDLKNAEDFFARRGVRCLGLRRAFEFVTRDRLPASDGADASAEEDGGRGMDADEEALLDRWLAEDAPPEDEARDGQEDAVFLRSHIPRSLNEVFDPERDAAARARGEDRGLVYEAALGLVPSVEEGDEDSEGHSEGDSDGADSDADEAEDGAGGFVERTPRGHRHEDRDAKKERKKAVKAEAKERRKHKMPKAEKKRSIKKGK
ncbi:RIO1-domain-containing protein [Mycena belliarum]|uniref:Serine/threonine-protein kinase RIO1 n=1 Tax=Mycena belliarum TaxID=1033014 RepID=A0AAD6UET0_9AGAR|nr:RIO1-domain-containing protein [Mycena belliae]